MYSLTRSVIDFHEAAMQNGIRKAVSTTKGKRNAVDAELVAEAGAEPALLLDELEAADAGGRNAPRRKATGRRRPGSSTARSSGCCSCAASSVAAETTG